ncbi:hypothetical protein CTI12_AA402050 [Artemisia annua]|uniref:cellulase n=1 Tax=Artemisia annua TaxID=35608 RepID=A0A2U1MAR0_ARTAN|nr:hypothetical protein CTI12_AA402050 [Artemisia annua]
MYQAEGISTSNRPIPMLVFWSRYGPRSTICRIFKHNLLPSDHYQQGNPKKEERRAPFWWCGSQFPGLSSTVFVEHILNSSFLHLTIINFAHPEPNVLYIQIGNPELDNKFWDIPEAMTEKRPTIKINTYTPGTEAWSLNGVLVIKYNGGYGTAIVSGICIKEAPNVSVLRLASLAEYSLNVVEHVGTYIELPSEAPSVMDDNRPPPRWPSSSL